MIRLKKEIKRVAIVVIFISIIFISNMQIINHSNLLKENINNENQLVELPNSANPEIDDYITGFGVDQDVRVYVNNESENLNDNQDFFEIPTVSDDMYLTYGDFNFTFQNNFTTEYVLEDDDALYADNFISFDYDKSSSGVSFTNGSLFDGQDSYIMDGNTENYVEYTSEGVLQGLLNFTIRANFTDTKFTDAAINGYVEFNRSNILALISSLNFSIDEDANLTVRIKDFSQSTWKEVISNHPINSSLRQQGLNEHFINENLNFIDLTSICYIQFIFERNDPNPFNTRLYEFDMQSTYAFDLSITDQEYVALEFDLQGAQSTVNGFYAWIRTLNVTAAASTQLNITLYRSNATVDRTDWNLRNVKLSPDYNEPIDTQLVSSYDGDQLSYFEFNIANTQDLNLSNYFVVIKSTNSEQVYSLVTIPHYNHGEAIDRTEHQLIITEDDGVNWEFSKKVVKTDYLFTDYINYNPDASSFKLNVTRGYMPSDFMFEDNNTLRIQNMTINNVEISSNESSDLTWGLGRWNNTFTTAIEDTPSNKFLVDLVWNKSIIEGFKFNVTSYSVNAYWIDGAVAYYNATYNENPEWALNFDFNKTDPNFINWDFIEFWYVYPNFMSAHNLTNPDPENKEFLWLLDEESIVTDSPSNLKLVINKTFSSLEGIYTLNLTSYNFIDEMHSYINYYGNLWETYGFMYGDNISIIVDIQDHKFNAPLSGDVNATLFYPNGTKYPNAEMTSSSGVIDDSVLTYDFNNNTILDVTDDIPVLGKYDLGFFWFNGSALGCKK